MASLGTVTLQFEYGNEKWADIMNSGQGPQEVTGGMVDLPQGGQHQSEAVATGGVYREAAEPATGIFDEMYTMVSDIFKFWVGEEVTNGDFSGAAERIKSLESFLTEFGRSRLLVYMGECENDDEREATEQVIDSFHVVVTCDISFDSILEEIKNRIASI